MDGTISYILDFYFYFFRRNFWWSNPKHGRDTIRPKRSLAPSFRLLYYCEFSCMHMDNWGGTTYSIVFRDTLATNLYYTHITPSLADPSLFLYSKGETVPFFFGYCCCMLMTLLSLEIMPRLSMPFFINLALNLTLKILVHLSSSWGYKLSIVLLDSLFIKESMQRICLLSSTCLLASLALHHLFLCLVFA